MGQNPKVTGTSLQGSSPSNEFWHVWKVIYKASSLETQCKFIRDSILLGAGHVDILHMASTNISDPQKENRCSA